MPSRNHAISVRIPFTIAKRARRGQTPIAKKIDAAMRTTSRKDWGPTVALDPREAETLLSAAKELRRKAGVTKREISAATKFISSLELARRAHGDNPSAPVDESPPPAHPEPSTGEENQVLTETFEKLRAMAPIPANDIVPPPGAGASQAELVAQHFQEGLARPLIELESLRTIAEAEHPGYAGLVEKVIAELKALVGNAPGE